MKVHTACVCAGVEGGNSAVSNSIVTLLVKDGAGFGGSARAAIGSIDALESSSPRTSATVLVLTRRLSN